MIRRIALLAVFVLCGCTHKNGTPYTGPEIYKLTREGALAACAAVDAIGPVVTIEGAQIPIVVARAVCIVIRATPEAIGVVAASDGTADPIGVSSGGAQ